MGTACNFVAEAETKEDAMKMAYDHAQKVHPKEISKKMKEHTKEEMDEMMEKKIKEEEI